MTNKLLKTLFKTNQKNVLKYDQKFSIYELLVEDMISNGSVLYNINTDEIYTFKGNNKTCMIIENEDNIKQFYKLNIIDEFYVLNDLGTIFNTKENFGESLELWETNMNKILA